MAGKYIAIRFFLLLLSIFLLIGSPLLSAFTTGANHIHAQNSKHRHHLSHAYFHHNSWNLISNRQLTAPPQGIKINDLVVVLCCAGFLFYILNLINQFVKPRPLSDRPPQLPNHLYLRLRSLLI